MEDYCISSTRVLLADSQPMQNQVLASALRQQGFQVSQCDGELASILSAAEQQCPEVVVLTSHDRHATATEMNALRALHLLHPHLPKVFLMEADHRDTVVQAFRFGARGMFSLADSSFQLFCECIQRVHRGEIWATTQQLNYLLESVCQVAGLRVVNACGDQLLTSREEQVVALVADGLSNRHVAAELGLSEHTVKKYLFRIFEKLGISNRVELVLYAMNHGLPQPVGWAAGA